MSNSELIASAKRIMFTKDGTRVRSGYVFAGKLLEALEESERERERIGDNFSHLAEIIWDAKIDASKALGVKAQERGYSLGMCVQAKRTIDILDRVNHNPKARQATETESA